MRHKFHAPLSTHLLLPSRSYPWLPMVVSLFLTHLLLEVASPITFPPSPFRCHYSSKSKGLHWWRRSKAYKLYLELHQKGFIPSEARPCLRFLGSCPKSIYKRSIVFHWGELMVCQSKSSFFLPFACHVRFFASSPLANNHLNLGIIGRYQHTFVGRE